MSVYRNEKEDDTDATAVTESRAGRSAAAELRDWLKSIAVALAIVVFLNLYVFNLSTVRGHSMEPTLKEREWLFVNKLAYRIGEPKRGDVVVLRDPDPNTGKQYLVKRIVAVPGDEVEIRGGVLYVNGEPVNEPYTDHRIEDGDIGPIVIEKDHYFVMGDNRHRGASKDSRMFGQVAEKSIQGRADFILWPLHEAGGL